MFLNHAKDFSRVTQVAAPGLGPDLLMPGTMVETLRGWRPAGRIVAGTRLFTYDGGVAQVRRVDSVAGPGDAIRLPACAFGADAETFLSPGQLVLVETGVAMTWLNMPVALARAEHLIGLSGVARRRAPSTRLVRLVLDDEQVLFASTGLRLFSGSAATVETSACYPVLTRDEVRELCAS